MSKSIADFVQNVSPDLFNAPGRRVEQWLETPVFSRKPVDAAIEQISRTDDTNTQAWALAPLIAGQPVYRKGRWIGNKFSYPGTKAPLRITGSLPTEPAAVLVHDVDGSARTLCLDLDTSRAHKRVVDNDARKLSELFCAAGLEFVADFSPSGGLHLYVPLQKPITAAAAREIVEALAERFTSLDPGPHQNVATGCIRVPGSVHKRGGHQSLITPLTQAHGILTRRNPASALAALCREIAAEIYLVRQMKKHQQQLLERAKAAAVELANRPVPEGAPHAGKASNEADSPLRILARTGLYDTAKYPSNSEARMAVLNHFVACRWTVEQVRTAMSGQFAGLAALYGEKAERLLEFEWDKAQVFVHGKKTDKTRAHGTAHISHTSQTVLTPGGAAKPSDRSIHHLVNDLENVLYAVLDHRLKDQGRAAISLRFLLRAVLAYMRTNNTNVLDVGCRTFAVALGKDHGTIARLLPLLEKNSAGILTRIQRARGRNADSYLVELPTEFEQLARDLTWRKGKIHGIRPVFQVLGDVAALTYEEIERGRRSPTTSELARTTGICRRALIDHLGRMESLQMIRRHHGRWEIIAATSLQTLADRLGATFDRQAQISLYRRQRAKWHAFLDRHTIPQLSEADIYDAEIDEYWLPPADNPPELQRQLWNAA